MERLEVNNLSHAFGFKKVLDGISFTLNKGEVLSIVGPSGGGKTTLLHLCANLLEVQEGKVHNSFKSSSFAFQEPRLLPWKTVIDNIALALLAIGVKKEEALQKAQDIALAFGLDSTDLNKFPKELSGGMKQRVSFARALVLHPSLLFLDEPFSALDIGLKRELQNHLIAHIAQENLSVLFITHDIMEAIRLSDTMILLKADPGHIVERFHFTTPQAQRDDAYIFEKTKEILQHPNIIETFELEIK